MNKILKLTSLIIIMGTVSACGKVRTAPDEFSTESYKPVVIPKVLSIDKPSKTMINPPTKIQKPTEKITAFEKQLTKNSSDPKNKTNQTIAKPNAITDIINTKKK